MKPNLPIRDLLDKNQHREILELSASLQLNRDQQKTLEYLALASPYALFHLRHRPSLLESLFELQAFSLDPSDIALEHHQKISLDAVKQRLRHYRHQKLVEIIYLDVVVANPLENTLRHLSDLADQLICAAVAACQQLLSLKHGQPLTVDDKPMELNLIAMGKLGGRELNFSSDIDLICCFESDGDLSGYGQLSYQEFFTRQVRMLNQLLAEATADGFVYRVDLRLRPWGDSGPVVLSHNALEHYYQLHGREWEQYAMVKARVLTGTPTSRAHLESIIQPFVYRKYHDYRVFDGLAGLKAKIDTQAKSSNMQDNIKVGPGGIREIEFFVQAFQILKGGRNHQLQSSEIFQGLKILSEHQIVDRKTVARLRDAYCFLRQLENRIQMYEDQQTHELPETAAHQARIAVSMGFSDWTELLGRLKRHREQVSLSFTDLFQQQSEQPELTIADDFAETITEDHQWDFISASGIDEAAQISHQFNHFLRSKAWGYMSARAKQRFSKLAPGLIKAIRTTAHPEQVFARFMRLFSSIAGRSVYFELLFQNQALLQKLASLFAQSAWIADEVSAYPLLLENLLVGGDRSKFEKSTLAQQLASRLATIAGDTELELDSLRLFKREQSLVIACAELAQEIDAGEAARYLSELAEVVLQAVYQLSRLALQQQYGIPQCGITEQRRDAQFAIIGYGKLGGYEMHYQSDLDLIFLHDSSGEQQQTNGTKCIENSVYFARLAQKIISMTGVLTTSGKLYEIDSRLRPEGSSGLLVSTSAAFLRYQLDQAWTWEHQALVRARPVAGDEPLCREFDSIRLQVLKLARDDSKLRDDICTMRKRIYLNKKPPEAARMNLKHSRGGLVDIEFMVQYWVLKLANNIGSECLYSDNISLIETLYRLDLISAPQLRLLEIYQDYHRLLHESVLRNQSAEIDSDAVTEQVEHVIKCWDDCFGLQEN